MAGTMMRPRNLARKCLATCSCSRRVNIEIRRNDATTTTHEGVASSNVEQIPEIDHDGRPDRHESEESDHLARNRQAEEYSGEE